MPRRCSRDVDTKSRAIAQDQSLDAEGKQGAHDTLLKETEAAFLKLVPQGQQSHYGRQLAATGINSRKTLDLSIEAGVKDQQIATTNEMLPQIVTHSFENPGLEAEHKARGDALIDNTPIDAEKKVARKQSFHAEVDLNAVNNELALGTDPQDLVERLQEKNKKGAFVNFPDLSPVNRTSSIKTAREKVAASNGLKIGIDIWEKDGPTGKMDLVDIEAMAAKAEKRAGTETGRNAAVTRIREQAALHNQARTALIKSDELAVWEAHDDGAMSTDIYKMPQFVELPSENRIAIQDKLRIISERASKEDTFKLRLDQLDRYEELASNPDKLKEADLAAERRDKSLSVSDVTSLKTMREKGSLPAIQMVEASAILKNARKDGLFADDAVENSKIYAENLQKLQDYMLLHPNANPLDAVEEILEPLGSTWIRDVLSTLTGGLVEPAPEPGPRLIDRVPPAAARPVEGTTATNPTTGDRLVFKDGKWQTLTK